MRDNIGSVGYLDSFEDQQGRKRQRRHVDDGRSVRSGRREMGFPGFRVPKHSLGYRRVGYRPILDHRHEMTDGVVDSDESKMLETKRGGRIETTASLK